MLIINTTAALGRALQQPLDHSLHRLLTTRRDQLGDSMEEAARFLIIEPPDTLADMEAAIGFSIATDDGPSWEWMEQHDGGWAEIVFVFSDDAPADVLLVPTWSDIDVDLIALIQRHAPTDDQAAGTITA